MDKFIYNGHAKNRDPGLLGSEAQLDRLSIKILF